MEFAVLKDRGRGAEDEIGRPFDIAILEILPADVAINGVLAAQETAIVENGLVPSDRDGQGLSDFPRAVLKGDVRGVKAGRVQEKAGRVTRPKGDAGSRVDQSIVIAVGKDGLRRAFTDHRDIDLVAGQGQGRLLVGAVLDVDDCPGRAVVGNGIESVLDVGVISRSVLGDDDVIAGLGMAGSDREKRAERYGKKSQKEPGFFPSRSHEPLG
jgi:hypothetical protein